MGNSGDIIYNIIDGDLHVRVVGEVLEEMREADNYPDRESVLFENAYEPEYTYTTADMFGANLSEAPCFLEELRIEDNGDADAVGDWWYYDNYMITDFTEKLANGETVVFTKVT